jgi:hypothetical protein
MPTDHQYPATLPPARQQAIEDILSRLRHELTQAHVAAAEWERQARQHEADLIAERAAHEATKREREQYAKAIVNAATDYAALERRLGETQAALALTEAAAGEPTQDNGVVQ